MHVAHVNLARGYRGGERQTELLIRELSARGHAQTVVIRRGGALGPRLRALDAAEQPPRIREVPWPYLPFAGACRGADVIHGHDGKSVGFAALASALTGAPLVLTRRMQAPPGSGTLTGAAYGRAAALVSLSQGARERLIDWSGRRDVRVIPSAASPADADPARAAAIRERYGQAFLVVYPAQLVPGQKGQETLIEAARRLREALPELRVLLLGRGGGEPVFRRLAADVPAVTFEGWVAHPEDYLAAADALAFPSLHEGLGSTILDAFRAGLPVVASDIPGVVDLVREGDTGLLVPPGDADALAGALLRLRRDPDLRERLATRGRAAASDYTPGRMADRYLALYREVTDARAGRRGRGEGRPGRRRT